jgi:hypothetical protein
VDEAGEDGGLAGGLFAEEHYFDFGFDLGKRRFRLLLLHLNITVIIQNSI